MAERTLNSSYVPGLAGVVAVQTELSSIDGQRGILTYRGIDIHELAENASYEEVVYLLWYGKLPTSNQLSELRQRLANNRQLPSPMYDLLRQMPREAVPMEVLRTAVSALAAYDPESEDISQDATLRKAARLTAQFPTLMAAYERIRHGEEPIAPRPDLSHAANTLYMLTGQEPDPESAKAMNIYYVLLADHGMNASTFTARVVASTQADLHSAITAALAALKGPLHGGANEATMKMLLEIGEPEKVDAWVDQAFANKRKIMGFGHRVYKTGDPRAVHLNKWSRHLGEKLQQLKYFEMSQMVETAVLRHRELYPNVDFFSATTLYYIGIPIDLFTPCFACSRVAGWSAHVMEQYRDNVLIRPQSEYIGPSDQHYTSAEQR